MKLTDRFADALTYAERLHRDQTRKGNEVPYVAHLLAVAATVLEWGGEEDIAIAALLHDAVEDQGGAETADDIRGRYGERVAELVLACSDSVDGDRAVKAAWEERKQAYIRKLETAAPDVAIITAADKLHNLTALVRDVRREGPNTLNRFARPDRIIWYYSAVAEALAPHHDHAPVKELWQQIVDLAELTSPVRNRI